MSNLFCRCILLQRPFLAHNLYVAPYEPSSSSIERTEPKTHDLTATAIEPDRVIFPNSKAVSQYIKNIELYNRLLQKYSIKYAVALRVFAFRQTHSKDAYMPFDYGNYSFINPKCRNHE